jgi:hypothetical protein
MKRKRKANIYKNRNNEVPIFGMAVLIGYSLAKMGLEVKEIKNVKGKE